MDFTSKLCANEINFYTDALGAEHLGFGCTFENFWTYSAWEPNFIKKFNPSIEYLELYVVAVAIELWANKLQNKKVIIFCDNKSVVEMINNTESSCCHCMKLIRIITLKSISENVRFFAKYVKSAENVLADALSRIQLHRFRKFTPPMVNEHPTPLPSKLWPVTQLWK